MATCPRCGGFLHEHHRCKGLWRLRLRAWRDLALGGIIGGAVGYMVLVGVTGQASWLSVAVTASIGLIVVLAWQRG